MSEEKTYVYLVISEDPYDYECREDVVAAWTTLDQAQEDCYQRFELSYF